MWNIWLADEGLRVSIEDGELSIQGTSARVHEEELLRDEVKLWRFAGLTSRPFPQTDVALAVRLKLPSGISKEPGAHAVSAHLCSAHPDTTAEILFGKLEGKAMEAIIQQCRRGQVPQAPDKPPPVYGSNLVEHDKADLFLKTTRNPEGVGMPAGRHGSDHKGTQRVVQFIRRNYRTRPHFLYFLALCWIQRNEVNVPTPGINHSQTHSDASNADRCGASSSPSSPLP